MLLPENNFSLPFCKASSLQSISLHTKPVSKKVEIRNLRNGKYVFLNK